MNYKKLFRNGVIIIMAKNRVSQHSARKGTAKHNGRKFDIEKAEHIDSELVGDNIIYPLNVESHKPLPKKIAGSHFAYDLENQENWTYKESFGDALEIVNKRYIKNSHGEKCKTIESWQKSKQNGPEEVILRIGDKDLDVPTETLQSCFDEYLEFLNDWNDKLKDVDYKKPNSWRCKMIFLGGAIHVDEPAGGKHIQFRRSWGYTDESGVLIPHQRKALTAAGVKLPDPTKPEGQYNNVKMTFDKMMREKWIDIVKAHGYDVETVPIPNQRTKDTKEFIRGREKDYLKRMEAVEAGEKSLEENQNDLKAREADLTAREADLTARESFQADLEENIKQKVEVVNSEFEARDADLIIKNKQADDKLDTASKLEITANKALSDAEQIKADANEKLKNVAVQVLSLDQREYDVECREKNVEGAADFNKEMISRGVAATREQNRKRIAKDGDTVTTSTRNRSDSGHEI